ncbi:hypothetical protein AAVH_30049 [Aphelenchoides avenae]|nr:hypothetical protein AAVH_30049 [Aphelenchus avenae]
MSSNPAPRKFSLTHFIACGIPGVRGLSSTPLMRKDGIAQSLDVIRKSSKEEAAQRKSSLIITVTPAEESTRTVEHSDASDSEGSHEERIEVVRSEAKKP